MNRCPITYKLCEGDYSAEGLHFLSPKLTTLGPFPYGLSQQLELAISFADKLSFSGVQPKISARLDLEKQVFDPVKSRGNFILKLPHASYEELPQNEDLTMHLASKAGIEVPLHGMIYAKDRSLIYFIKRFDRGDGRKKIHTEDIGQLAGLPTEAKYDFSMEKVAKIIDHFCTFKVAEKAKLFRLTLFNFLVGNEDMHVKNFSIIVDGDVVRMSPAYDLVNSTITIKGNEEIALSLSGKKSNLKRDDLVDYYGKEKLELSDKVIDEMLNQFALVIEPWIELISISFLSRSKKKAYLQLLQERRIRLGM